MDSPNPPSKESVKQGIDDRSDALKEKEDASQQSKPTSTPLSVPQELKQNVNLITRAVQTLEPRFTARVLRTLTTLRKKIYREALVELIESVYPKSEAFVRSPPSDILPIIAFLKLTYNVRRHLITSSIDSEPKQNLLQLSSLLPTQASKSPASSTTITQGTQAMEIDDSIVPPHPASIEPDKEKKEKKTEIVPEVDVYVRLLIILGLIDIKELEKAFELARETSSGFQELNRRSLDHLAARVWFYFARIGELLNKDEEVRPLLLAAHSTASLRTDEDTQATLLNTLLRNYFSSGLYDLADKFLSKTSFPESAGNNQLARYLFYLGRIRAIQLNYTEAHAHLQNAIRRSPSEHVAPGFVQTVHKYFVVVELLMGDIPERSIFRRNVLRRALGPYFQLVQAVRIGDLEAFQNVLDQYRQRFVQDGTHSLILRLRHNVIKTALRMISLAYSRISLKDICLKLHLDSEEDTEYIVAKAIRDGVIDAEVDHAKGWMKSREAGNVYETDEPQKAFQQRIEFCLNLRNDSVKAMRYPLNANKSTAEDSEMMRERKLDIEAAMREAEEDEFE